MTPYYQDSVATIYCADMREVLPLILSVDHVITDPPYDAETHYGARSGGLETAQGINFAPIDPAWVAPLILGVSRRWVLAFCSLQQLGSYRIAAGPDWVRAGTWHKMDGAPQFTGDRPAQGCDGIAILHRQGKKRWNGGGTQAHWSYGVERTARQHPTQKPEALMLELVNLFTDPGETILDPFMGSGTTGVAAKRIGRKFIGIEMQEAYCEAAVSRLSQGSLSAMFERHETRRSMTL